MNMSAGVACLFPWIAGGLIAAGGATAAGQTQLTPGVGVTPGAARADLGPGAHQLAPRPFTEEAQGRGLSYEVLQNQTFGCGAAFSDLDGDGDPDLVLLGLTTLGTAPTVGIFENDGSGAFIDHSASSGIPGQDLAAGVSAGDYDGDGDPDLYITAWLRPNLLLRNDGNFTFTNVTGTAGFQGLDDEGAGSGSCWGDIDGDGWLDLYVTNRTTTAEMQPPFTPDPTPNRMFVNQAGQGFVEVAGLLGIDADDDPSFCASFFDYDQDGDADLYLSNDKGAATGCATRNIFWENQGSGTFLDISQSSKTNGCIDAMCVALGDYDNNLWTDIYVSNTPPGNVLYLNQSGVGTFLEDAVAWGVVSYQIGWGSILFDYDNDGWQDLYVCQHRDFEPNRLFVHAGNPPATDQAYLLGIDDAGESFVCARADVDADGDLDLLVSNRGEQVKLFINHEGQRRSWVAIDVVGQGANQHAIGAQVQITAAGRPQYAEVIAGSAFKSQDALTLHWGLAGASVVEQILGRWPSGATRQLTGYSAETRWSLYPPDRLGDAEGDGDVDLADFQALAACWDQPVAPGCEVFDMNGDAAIDLLDWALFEQRYTGPLGDCNTNGSEDLLDILEGTSPDSDQDGVPDECQG